MLLIWILDKRKFTKGSIKLLEKNDIIKFIANGFNQKSELGAGKQDTEI